MSSKVWIGMCSVLAARKAFMAPLEGFWLSVDYTNWNHNYLYEEVT